MNAAVWPKVCGCRRSHVAEGWRDLRLVGRMDQGTTDEIEIRDCGCGSSIAVLVTDLPSSEEAA